MPFVDDGLIIRMPLEVAMMPARPVHAERVVAALPGPATNPSAEMDTLQVTASGTT